MSAHRTVRCLIIDDSKISIVVYKSLLPDLFRRHSSLSLSQRHAQTIREAIGYCLIHDVDLIFLDDHMPNDVGLTEALHSLHATFVGRSMPYIIIRKTDDDTPVAGANDSFLSPLSTENLEPVVCAFIEYFGSQ